MEIVTVSPKFQVVIPKAVREQMCLESGQKLQVSLVEGRIELTLIRRPQDLRGRLRGIDTEVVREGDRV